MCGVIEKFYYLMTLRFTYNTKWQDIWLIFTALTLRHFEIPVHIFKDSSVEVVGEVGF